MAYLIHKLRWMNPQETTNQDSVDNKVKPKSDDPSRSHARTAPRTVSHEQVEAANENLRIQSVEKEIVHYALAHLEEAKIDGRLTEEDYAHLLEKYHANMKTLDKAINKNERIIKLYELEGVQIQLIQTVIEKLDEIDKEIEYLKDGFKKG